jgi:hypothetical protein
MKYLTVIPRTLTILKKIWEIPSATAQVSVGQFAGGPGAKTMKRPLSARVELVRVQIRVGLS